LQKSDKMDPTRTVIIAEIGVNHNGDLQLAKELIREAAKAGADLVKFQTFKTHSCISQNAPLAAYQEKNMPGAKSQLEMITALELSDSDHHTLNDTALQNGIQMFSTAFDVESLSFLSQFNFPYVKIPSGEVTNLPLLRAISRQRKDIIISTGMCNLGDIEQTIETLLGAGVKREAITLLHCTTEYPAPFSEVNLNAIKTLRKCFGTSVGYSDHTKGIAIPIAAVSLGAKIIEKHFTLDRFMPGPDHLASIEPDEFASMVTAIRQVEEAMGDGVKRVTESENKNILIARKSLVASMKITKGDLFSNENIAVKRPGTGLSPMLLDDIIGRKVSRDFKADELIEI
jgi:N,N'-diacetyllegionaminate synthase